MNINKVAERILETVQTFQLGPTLEEGQRKDDAFWILERKVELVNRRMYFLDAEQQAKTEFVTKIMVETFLEPKIIKRESND